MPEYEVVPVRHVLHKRNINELSFQTKINGVDQEIYLHPTESLLAGTATEIFIASNDGYGGVKFESVPDVSNRNVPFLFFLFLNYTLNKYI